MGLIKSNLPSDSQPWARDIEDRLVTVEGSLSTNEVNNNARDAQLQTSINAVSDALSQVRTASVSQSRRQDFANGTFYSRPVILSFEKPSWANYAVVSSTVCVDAVSIYSGVSNPIYGTAGIYINDVLSTYETYELNSPIPNVSLIKDNTKDIVAVSSATNTYVKDNITLVDSQEIKFEGSVLKVWGAFVSLPGYFTPEIPPNDYANWTPLQIATWNVGVNAYSSFSIDISTTVLWSAR